MAAMRDAIAESTFDAFAVDFTAEQAMSDIEPL
jgi:hypothetical protein